MYFYQKCYILDNRPIYNDVFEVHLAATSEGFLGDNLITPLGLKVEVGRFMYGFA